jgi:transposase
VDVHRAVQPRGRSTTLVGLDVHATKVVAAVPDAESGELRMFAMNSGSGEVAGFCAGLPSPVRVAYEAGPTGYELACELAKRRVECGVAAPSKIPRASGDRVKTDRPDAELLVRLLLAGKLHAVLVPGPEEEALRDLVRAREAVRVDLMRCRHRLSKLLLRHGIRFDDGPAWTQRHRDWLHTIALEWPAAQATLLDAQGAIDALVHRRGQLEREIVALVPSSPWSVQVGQLRCLRGIDTLSAVGLCAEIGDFERFARAEGLMSYVGAGPLRASHRAPTPARVDHEDRVRARPAAADRGRLALPPAPADRQSANRPPGRPARPGRRDGLVSPAASVPHLDTTRATLQTPHHHRRRRRPRTRRVRLGDHPNRVTAATASAIPSARSVAARQRAGNPRSNYEQPAPEGLATP